MAVLSQELYFAAEVQPLILHISPSYQTIIRSRIYSHYCIKKENNSKAREMCSNLTKHTDRIYDKNITINYRLSWIVYKILI